MDGVEILSSVEVASEYAFNETASWIVFGVVLGLFVIWGICIAIEECSWEPLPVMGLLGAILAILLGVVVGDTTATPVAYETQYKVIIDDSVSMNEFLDKYEIIDQEGKIYTVRERD